MPDKSILVNKSIERKIQEKRFYRALTSKSKKNAIRKWHTVINQKASEHSKFAIEKMSGLSKEDSYQNIRIPPILDITREGDETLELLRDIRRLVLGKKRPVRLVFDKAIDIKPASLLLLLAEMHRCRLIHGDSKLTGTYPESGSKLEKIFHSTGFFKLLGVKSHVKQTPRHFPMEYVPFISDIRPPKDLSKQFRKALFGEEIKIEVKIRRQLVRAIGEAVINVGQHAYPKYSFHNHPTGGRWWLSGHVNKRKAILTIMFCDLGVGIPETLPKLYPIERIRAFLSLLPGVNPNDGQMIRAGMEIGRSQTMQTHRGKGLNDLRRIIDVAGEGELHIFSRKGCYRYSPGKPEEIRNFDISVGGTLIKWTIPLNKITDWVGGEVNEEN